MSRARGGVGCVVVAALLAACNGDGPAAPGMAGCGSSQPATVVSLQPGEVHLELQPGAGGCLELQPAAGRYILAVLNANTAAGTLIGFSLRGAAGAAPAVATSVHPATPIPPWPAHGDAEHPEAFGHRVAHGDMLARNLELLRTLPRREGRVATPGMLESVVAQSVNPIVGTISTVRLMDVDSDATLCRDIPFEELEVRTVYSGTRAIIVEDTQAPLASQMDSYFVAMGQEFDQVMWPILTQNFGNPLALDPQLDNNQRIVMVFSHRVNAFERGVAGFVISCDFAAQSQVPGSNEGEFFYAIVPTSAAQGFTGPTRDNWRRLMRAVVIHEVKHITSFAERISRGAPTTMPFEDLWLEEATAMIAEELWARTIYGVGWRQNVTYEESVYCDIRPTFPDCAGAPIGVINHFLLMYRYLDLVEQRSPLGDPPGQTGSTFYGSGWSLVRWAIDQYAASEPGFLLPLTQGPLAGIENIQARTNRPWPEMLAHWSLANAVDDRPGFTPQSDRIRHPSWHYRDIYASLRADLPQVFARPYPLVPRAITFGAFAQTVPSLAGGTASFFELFGSAAGSQFIEVRSAQGGTPPAAARLAIVRVE